VEAEEVRRTNLQRGVLRTRDPVDERDSGLFLGVVGDRDSLAPGERAHEDVDFLLLDEPPSFLDCLVGSRVGPPVHDLNGVAGDDGARYSLSGIAADGSSASVDERKHRSAPGLAFKRSKGTFVVREDSDLDRLSSDSAARRGPTCLAGAFVVAAAGRDARGKS
jgi:hypothetical protein